MGTVGPGGVMWGSKLLSYFRQTDMHSGRHRSRASGRFSHFWTPPSRESAEYLHYNILHMTFVLLVILIIVSMLIVRSISITITVFINSKITTSTEYIVLRMILLLLLILHPGAPTADCFWDP